MATHLLDGGTTKCSCRGGGCKICNASNQLISFHNELMKFGLSKEMLKENLKTVNPLVNKVDSFTLYEFLTGAIDEEKLNEAIEQYSPRKKKTYKPKSEVEGFMPTVNSDMECVFDSNSPRARCKKCNSIRKYMKGKTCLMYQNN